MISQFIAQMLFVRDDSYIDRCAFSIQTQRFYFHKKWRKTDDDILQIHPMIQVENPSNLPHLEKMCSHLPQVCKFLLILVLTECT